MRKTALLFVALAAIGLPAMAQSPGAETRVRVVGMVEKLDGDRLSITTAGGPAQVVGLTPSTAIFGAEKRGIDDIKQGTFVASGGVRGTDGKIHAVDVRIFSEAPRGIREGLGLNKPIYLKTAAYGHFGRKANGDFFPWEKTDLVDALKAALG